MTMFLTDSPVIVQQKACRKRRHLSVSSTRPISCCFGRYGRAIAGDTDSYWVWPSCHFLQRLGKRGWRFEGFVVSHRNRRLIFRIRWDLSRGHASISTCQDRNIPQINMKVCTCSSDGDCIQQMSLFQTINYVLPLRIGPFLRNKNIFPIM